MPRKPTNGYVTIPLNLNTPEFIAAWDEYVEYRRQRKLPKLIPVSVQKQWDRLSDFGPEAAIAAINETIAQQYQGIFPRGENLQRRRPAASLGALQLELQRIENELNDIYYPGGCAFRVEPSPSKRERAARLLDQRKNIRMKIENLKDVSN